MEPFSHDHGVDRLRNLVAELQRLTFGEPYLDVGIHGTLSPTGQLVDPDRGIHARLELAGAEIELRLTPRGATVEAISNPPGTARGLSRIRDKLPVYLGRGYCWADAVYESPAALAAALLWHMRERGFMVARVCPPATTGIERGLTGTRALATLDAG